MAASQLVRLPRVARRNQAGPAHQYVRPAIAHLELEQLLLRVERHFVLGNAVRASRWRWWADIRVVAEADGSSEARAQAFDVEFGEDAPRGGYVEPARVGRSAREDPEGAHPSRGEQRARREGRVLRVQQYLVPHRRTANCTSRREASSSALRRSCRCCKSDRTTPVTRPIRNAAALPDRLGRVRQ